MVNTTAVNLVQLKALTLSKSDDFIVITFICLNEGNIILTKLLSEKGERNVEIKKS